MRIIIALALVLLAAGCSSHRSFIDEPIIDRKGVDMTVTMPIRQSARPMP